jgi:hypothetical protein
MKSRLICWLRLVAPPDWCIAALLIGCGLFELLYLWLCWLVGWQVQVVGTEFFKGRDMLCLLAAALLGNFRIAGFHPQFDTDYCNWLWLSPWRANKPLPKGPLHLVPQDVLLVGGIAGLMYHHGQLPLLLVPLCFLVGYYFSLMLSLWAVDLPWLGYALSFFTGLTILAAKQSLILGIEVAAAEYLFAWICIRRTLTTFPWSARAIAWRLRAAKNRQAVLTGQRVSLLQTVDLANPELEAPWPFNRLHPRTDNSIPSRANRVAMVLLAGWWAFVLLSLPEKLEVALSIGWMLYTGVLSVCLVARLSLYVVPCRPPIGFWGRLCTFRWIIPGYDQVFLTPAATLAMAIGTPLALHQLGLPPIVVLSLSFLPVLGTTLLGGPRLSRWLLTSNARLSPGIKNQQMFEEI